MQSLKIIRRRIHSVRNTQKVTKAMKLVAAARLRRAQRTALAARSYTGELFEMIKRISRRAGPMAPPIMRRRKEIKNLDVLVFTSDRGLCGGFNENLLITVLDGIEQHISHGIGVNLFVIGKKGWLYLKKRYPSFEKIVCLNDESGRAFAERLTDMFIQRFLTNISDGAFLALNRFYSASQQKAVFWNFLPLHWRGFTPDRLLDYLYEPERDQMRAALTRHVLVRSIEQAMLESKAAELAARMIAMDSATKNAQEMISSLTLEYHKARQSAITAELLDIVGGAEALK